MLSWIKTSVSSIVGWLGSGIGSLFEWLLGGVATIFTKIFQAATGFWSVLDSLWDFAVGFKDDLLGLFSAFFPFVPAPVSTMLALGLLSVLLAGIVRKVRGK